MTDKVANHADIFHIEKEYGLDIKMGNYKMLSNTTFQGEPVVPMITEFLGPNNQIHLKTEKLGGQDLTQFIQRDDVSVEEKINIFLLVTQQFKAIDESGYVLADRHGSNIRVIPGTEKGKYSIRQMDIKEIYDKTTGQNTTTSNRNSFGELVRIKKSHGIDLWQAVIDDMFLEEKMAFGHDPHLTGLFKNKLKDMKSKPSSGLDDHIDFLQNILKAQKQVHFI